MMNLCIPFNAIERIGNKLSANTWVSYGKRETTPETMAQIGSRLQGSLVEMVVQLAETRISTGDLIGLRVGDIITTEKDTEQSALLVSVEGVPKFRAKVGAYKGRKAVCVDERLDSAGRVERARKRT